MVGMADLLAGRVRRPAPLCATRRSKPARRTIPARGGQQGAVNAAHNPSVSYSALAACSGPGFGGPPVHRCQGLATQPIYTSSGDRPSAAASKPLSTR